MYKFYVVYPFIKIYNSLIKYLFLTKLSVILMMISIVQANATSYAQNISLSVRNSTLENVFTILEKQSTYSFLFNSEILKATKSVNISVENMPFQQVLERCFSDQPVSYTIDGNTVIVFKKTITSIKADVEISGKITDEKGEPLPGVSIKVKDSQIGVVSDNNGNYVITIPVSEATLIFTFVGFADKEVKVGNSRKIDVILTEQETSLDEVMVVGYNTVRKGDLTGAVSSINAKDVNSAPVARVDQAIQGRAAGVQVTSSNGAPGTGSTIRIRGGNSINAGNEPLYIIDGFIGDADLNQINPADIKSIDILKDASATAIYGARGANGVVIITTKRGSVGKTQVNLNTYYGIQDLPRKIDVLNAVEFAQFANEDAAFIGNPPPFTNTNELGAGTDWQNEITRVAPIKNLQLSASGGSENNKFYISGNYFDQQGIIISSGLKRYQFRLNLDNKLSDKIDIGTSLNISRNEIDNNTINLRDAISALPTTPVYISPGVFGSLNEVNGNIYNNPIAQATLIDDNNARTGLIGNFFAEYKPIENFTFKTSIGTNLDFTKVNQYSASTLPKRLVEERGGLAVINSSNEVVLLNENILTYNKQTDKSSLNALIGYTVQTSRTEGYGATGQGFNNDQSLYNNLETSDPQQREISSDYSKWALVSLLARVDYSIDGKYLFTATGRRDGSSRFGKNNKYAFFPSAAFAWRLSDEPFISELGIFDNLKLRASYGLTGNQGIDPYRSLSTLGTGLAVFNDSQSIAYNQARLASPDLKWETTSQFDGGLEMLFLNGRIAFEVDYYHKITRDLLLEVEIPWQTGFNTKLQNIGKIQNHGLEVVLKTTNINRENFTWNTNLNIATNKNKVLDLGGKESIITLRRGSANRKVSELKIGQPVGIFSGAIYEGTWKSQEEIDRVGTMPTAKPGYPRFKDTDGNGKFEGENDFVTIGNSQPDFYGGIQNSFVYKGWDLSVFFQFSYGNEVMNLASEEMAMGYPSSNVYKEFINRWSPENPDSDVPRAGSWELNKFMTSSKWVEDGSFLRLKSAQLGYMIPVNKVSKLRSLYVYVSGNNLFLLDKYEGFDPEVSNFGSNSTLRGFDNVNYPQSRTVTVGINVGL